MTCYGVGCQSASSGTHRHRESSSSISFRTHEGNRYSPCTFSNCSLSGCSKHLRHRDTSNVFRRVLPEQYVVCIRRSYSLKLTLSDPHDLNGKCFFVNAFPSSEHIALKISFLFISRLSTHLSIASSDTSIPMSDNSFCTVRCIYCMASRIRSLKKSSMMS